MSGELDTWPDLLRDFAQLIGQERALQVAQRFGGLERVHIPKNARPDHPWAQLLGQESWRLICQHYGGERLDIPRGHFLRLRKREIIDLDEQGLAPREIALRTGTTQRYVRSVIGGGRGRRVDPRQVKLPFD